MSEESKSNKPAAPTPLGEIEHGPSKFDDFMEKNLKFVILLALLAVVAVAGFVIMSQLGEAKDREAGHALLAAESPDDYRQVSKDFPDSGAAASASLLLAGQLWDEGKEDDAVETLKSLVSSGDDLTAGQARFALAGMQVKQGKTDEAKANYEALLSNSDTKYLQPLSLVALGDIAAAAGDEERAKEYYQRKLDDFQKYADQNMAVTRMNLVGVDAPEKVSPPPAPEPAPNPNAGVSPAFTTPLPNPNVPSTLGVPGTPGIIVDPPTPRDPSDIEEAPEVTPTPPAEEAAAETGEETEMPDVAPLKSAEGETPIFEEPAAAEEE